MCLLLHTCTLASHLLAAGNIYTYVCMLLFIPFLILGSPNLPYGRKALDAALVQLYRFYRTSAVVWRCQDWEDWESMATVFRQEEQWPQVNMYASVSMYMSVISLCAQ